MLALVIDHCTSAEVSKINWEIGHSVYWWNHGGRFHSSLSEREKLERDLEAATRDERLKKNRGEDYEYEGLLREYVQQKLFLHNLRKTLYYPYDTYTPPDDYKKLIDRCDELKQKIKEKRRIVMHAAWGGLEPAAKPTDYDKPILYSLEERTCNFWMADILDEEGGHDCPFNGEHWFRGKAYCKAHFHETRKAERTARHIESRRARTRFFAATNAVREQRAQIKAESEQEEALRDLRPADPMEPCVVPGCWELGRHDHENMSAANLVQLIKERTVQACADSSCQFAFSRHAHLPDGKISMLESRPQLPHGKANARRNWYFA